MSHIFFAGHRRRDRVPHSRRARKPRNRLEGIARESGCFLAGKGGHQIPLSQRRDETCHILGEVEHVLRHRQKFRFQDQFRDFRSPRMFGDRVTVPSRWAILSRAHRQSGHGTFRFIQLRPAFRQVVFKSETELCHG